jgi:tRNA(fMet)-specific endonuclease VapC
MVYKKLAIETCTFSLLLRGNKVIKELISHAETVAMPIITIAELNAGFLYGNKTEKYSPILDNFLTNPSVTILHITSDTTPIYAELYAFSRLNGKKLSNNDLWIAALCIQYNYPLLTTDKDFDTLPQVRKVRKDE